MEKENISENDGRKKRLFIMVQFGLKNTDEYLEFIKDLYILKQMCSQEIVDFILKETGIEFTPRSIQRIVSKLGIARTVRDAYHLSMDKDRVKWAYKEAKIKRKKMPRKLRYSILSRDNFKCVLCGADANSSVLEVDHIIPVCRGGETIESNLRVLCIDCNIGKSIVEHER